MRIGVSVLALALCVGLLAGCSERAAAKKAKAMSLMNSLYQARADVQLDGGTIPSLGDLAQNYGVDVAGLEATSKWTDADASEEDMISRETRPTRGTRVVLYGSGTVKLVSD